LILLSLFGICFLSATIVPFPSEAAVIYCLQEKENAFVVLLIASIGNSLGGSTNYFLGKFGSGKFKKKKNPKSEALIQKFGTYAACFSFIPFVGDPLMIALGFYKTPIISTLVLMTIGKTLRFLFLYYSYCFVVN
jgi:membrane protein YqaA with SNARE-associated domain